MLLARLLGTSGFSADALAEDRLRAWLQLRGRELGLDAESAARAQADGSKRSI